MKSQVSEAERTLLADKELDSKQAGSGTIQVSEWTARGCGSRAMHDTIKLWNNDRSLELVKKNYVMLNSDAGSRGREDKAQPLWDR